MKSDRIVTDPTAEVKYRFEISIGGYSYARGCDSPVTRAYAAEQMAAFVADATLFMNGKPMKRAKEKR